MGTHLANQTAWTTLGASHHASGVASAINTAATAASWLGVGSAASALNVTMLNATLHGLAGWVDVKPAVVSTAIAAFETANAAMRPAPECMENRDEWGVDNAINPSVLWTLTPRIVSLDVEYFGVMWPNNAAVGATYGGVLAALAESLAIPPPVATMGASPAAPAQAAAAVGQAAAEAAAGDGMRSAYQGVQAGSTGAGQSTSAGENFGNQLSTFMQPMQAVMQAAPQALQAPSGLMQAPMSAMQPLQSMVGMFANPGALGMGGAAPGASAASAAGGFAVSDAHLHPRIILASCTRRRRATQQHHRGGRQAARQDHNLDGADVFGGNDVHPGASDVLLHRRGVTADPMASPSRPRRCVLSMTGGRSSSGTG
ncbi:PPE family protein [Mycobacterium tuberculosis]|nr:PPE family protein [Mycobacterium tuberculosis]